MSLTLYYHPLSSYCHKVLIALFESGTAFDKRIINLGNARDRAELGAMWPFTRFPVIRDHLRDESVAESSIIIEYLDHYFPGAAPMIPDDWIQALEVRRWDRIFDQYVQGPLQAIVSDRIHQTSGDMGKARATLTTAYALIDRHVADREWISSAGFSLADCSAAPALFYAHTLEPFPVSCVQLHAYFERLVARPSIQRVLDETKPYFSMYPFVDAIPARFR